MTERRTILVTGANGFVGRATVKRLLADGWMVRAAVRELPPPDGRDIGVDWRCVGEVNGETDWAGHVACCEAVVHLAARVHVMNELAADPLAAFRAVNVQGTVNLARQAAAAGVRRFVFISSIKVNGESTQAMQPFTEADVPNPQDTYGVSKHEAEMGLRLIGEATGMEVVIIRPPLVYGPGVKANFLEMIRWLERGIPLPLGAIYNKRSFVALDNLVDLMVACFDNPAAANQTFLVSDGEDMSTTQLLRRMSAVLDKPSCLIPVPVWMLKAGAPLLCKRSLSQRLWGNLQVDISKARSLLGWAPPVSIDEALRRTAAGWKDAGI